MMPSHGRKLAIMKEANCNFLCILYAQLNDTCGNLIRITQLARW
jgi:hypothetical protein